MAITLGNITSNGVAATYNGFAHNNNGEIIVVVVNANTGGTISGVPVYAGSNLTLASSAVSSIRKAWVYYHLNPASGSNTLAITMDAGVYQDATIYSLNGVHDSPIGDTDLNSSSGSGSSSTLNFTVSEDSIIIDAFSTFGSYTGVGSGQTLQRSVNPASSIRFVSSYKNGVPAGAASMRQNFSTTDGWGHAGLEILSAVTVIAKTYLETIIVVDTITRSVKRAFSEAIVIVDTVAPIKIISKVYSEIITIADTLLRKTSKLCSQVVTIVDTFSRVFTGSRIYSEIITIVDTFSSLRIFARVYSEIITVTDTLSRKISRVFSQVITIVDTLARSLQRALSDAIDIVDTIALAKIISKVYSEIITVTDTVSRSLSRVFSNAITLVGTLSRTVSRTFLEAVVIVATFTKVFSFSRTLSETIQVLDTLRMHLNGLVVDFWNKTAKTVTTWTKAVRNSSIWTKTPKPED